MRQEALPLRLKRAIDVVAAGAGLVVTSPILAAAAAALWVTDGSPVLFRQERPGRAGRPFRLLKFRTMRNDPVREGLPQFDADRLTRVGRFLRDTSIDELPQLWNVLRGDMSLVGPRPERPEFFTDLERQMPLFRARLLVKPGISGWAQVNYGYASTLQDNIRKLQWDLFYVKHMSPWLDTSILLRTIGVVVRLKGT